MTTQIETYLSSNASLTSNKSHRNSSSAFELIKILISPTSHQFLFLFFEWMSCTLTWHESKYNFLAVQSDTLTAYYYFVFNNLKILSVSCACEKIIHHPIRRKKKKRKNETLSFRGTLSYRHVSFRGQRTQYMTHQYKIYRYESSAQRLVLLMLLGNRTGSYSWIKFE